MSHKSIQKQHYVSCKLGLSQFITPVVSDQRGQWAVSKWLKAALTLNISWDWGWHHPAGLTEAPTDKNGFSPHGSYPCWGYIFSYPPWTHTSSPKHTLLNFNNKMKEAGVHMNKHVWHIPAFFLSKVQPVKWWWLTTAFCLRVRECWGLLCIIWLFFCMKWTACGPFQSTG